MDNLLQVAQKHVLEMNKLMTRIEEIDAKVAGISEGAELIFRQPGCTTMISDILDQEKMKELADIAMAEICKVRQSSTDRLAHLMGIAPEPEQIIEKPDQKAVKPDQKAAEPERKKLDPDTVRSMYIDQEMTVKEIAEEHGCTVSAVSKFLGYHNIPTRPRGGSRKKTVAPETSQECIPAPVLEAVPETKPELTVKAVREIYTDGTTSLSEAAKHFGIDSTVLHDFVNKHGLKKTSKKDRIYRDAGKVKP